MSTELPEDSYTDHEEGATTIRTVTKFNDPKRAVAKPFRTRAFVLFCLCLTFYPLFYYILVPVLDDQHSSGSSEGLESYVFPNTSLIITSESAISIQGDFTVDDIHYEFMADHHSLSFLQIATNSIGFTVTDHNQSDPVFVLKFLDEDGITYSSRVTPNEPANVTVVHKLVRSILVEHFVELSAKLGSAGYIGSEGEHIQDLHRFAQWMYNYDRKWMEYDIADINSYGRWDNMTKQFEKVNDIVFASSNAGYWIDSMDDLVTYSSSDYSNYSDPRGGSRRGLLGNCGTTYKHCDNECFGGCGNNCNCWSWVCGSCDCWLGCEAHDHYCSCGMFQMMEYCCINVMWVKCDGSGSC